MGRKSLRVLAGLLAILAAVATVPCRGQPVGTRVSSFDSPGLAAALGTDLGSVPMTAVQKTLLMSGRQKHYLVFSGDPLSRLAAGPATYWNGSVLIPTPEKTGKPIRVTVSEKAWNYSGWWYKNADGSISRLLNDSGGQKVGVVTMAGDGTVVAVIDLDHDGIAESMEQVLPGGLIRLLVDRVGLAMQESWLSGHNPFCRPGKTDSKFAPADDGPGIGLIDARPAVGLCRSASGTPGFSTEAATRTGSDAKRGPSTVDQMCNGITGGPKTPGSGLARDDVAPVTRWVVGVVVNGTDGKPDSAVSQAARSVGLFWAVGIAAAVDVLVHEVTHPLGAGSHMPVGPSPDETMEQFCKAQDDTAATWGAKIGEAMTAIEKECPNPASQPVPSATKQQATNRSVNVYCSKGQQEGSQNRADTADLFGFSKGTGCARGERPAPGSPCRQRLFKGTGGNLAVAYGDTLVIQVCPTQTCTSPER
jgi:hypothetical protein